jgi:hypothetical protein
MCLQDQGGSVPRTDYLIGPDGLPIKYTGKWNAYNCTQTTNGQTEQVYAFVITQPALIDITNQCKARGFQIAKPTDASHQGFDTAFETDRQLSERYHMNQGIYQIEPAVAVDKC